MEKYISILRGINVSGKNKIPMKDLKELYEGLGFEKVVTYIQSGNVIFDAPAKVKENGISATITRAIKAQLGFDVPVIIRTAYDMAGTVKNNPFLQEKEINTEKLHVTFLENLPLKEHLEKAATYSYPPHRFIIIGKEVYLYCPDGYGNTKLNNTFFENKLKTTATTRNWRTVNELLKLAGGG